MNNSTLDWIEGISEKFHFMQYLLKVPCENSWEIDDQYLSIRIITLFMKKSGRAISVFQQILTGSVELM